MSDETLKPRSESKLKYVLLALSPPCLFMALRLAGSAFGVRAETGPFFVSYVLYCPLVAFVSGFRITATRMYDTSTDRIFAGSLAGVLFLVVNYVIAALIVAVQMQFALE